MATSPAAADEARTRQGTHRVVVTGLGAISPFGNSVGELWDGLAHRPPAIQRITQFDASDLPVQIAGEATAFDPREFMDHKSARRSSRFVQMGVAAAAQALRDAEYAPTRDDEVGIFMATTGALFTTSEATLAVHEHGWERADPLFVARMDAHMAAARVGLELGLRGPSTSLNSACASGHDAIGQAMNALRLGHAEAMLAGGAEASNHPFAISIIGRIGALTRSFNDDPTHASRPFDKRRDGFVIGEGAGVLLLETLEHARARGARIYCELLGAGWAFDAADDTAPDAGGQALAMRRALRDADLRPDEISAVKAHATSTRLNDRTETAAIKEVFGEAAYDMPVVALKSKIGHSMAASGGVETVASVLMLSRQTMLPTVNLEVPDPDCDLGYVTDCPRPAPLETMLLNAFGMGGQNACLVIRRWGDGAHDAEGGQSTAGIGR